MKVYRILPVLAIVVVTAVAGAHFVMNTDMVSAQENHRLNETRTAHFVHEYVNEERADRGLPPLEYDRELAAIATNQTHSMADQGGVSSTAATGGTDRDARASSQCEGAAAENATAVGLENLGKTQVYTPVETSRGTEFFNSERELAQGIVDAWMQSPQQRERLLHSSWHADGVGVEIRSDDTVYVAQEFC